MIYKQNDKIITNLSGEIFKKPPIIDISSEYGVVKDGSNLVSSVRDINRPMKGRTTLGKEPVENGEGFVFNGNAYINLGASPAMNWTKAFSMEMWFKPSSIITGDQYYVAAWNYPVTYSYFRLFIQNSAPNLFEWDYRNAQNTFRFKGLFTINNLDEYHHILIVQDKYSSETRMSSLLDGTMMYSTDGLPIDHEFDSPPLYLGGEPINNRNVIGSLQRFRWFNHGTEKYQHRDRNFNIQFADGDQVFTPPTFPNTIL